MSIKISIFASWTAHLVTMLTGFLLMPYILKVLGDTTYGTWLFLSSVAAYSGLLYLGFGQTISRFTAKYRTEENWEKLNQTATCIFSVYLSMAVFVTLVGIVFALIAPYVRSWTNLSVVEIQLVFIILALNAAVGLVGSVFGGLLIGMQRFDLERSVIVITTIIRAVITIIFLQQQWGLLILALSFLTVTILENLLYYYHAHRCIHQLKLDFRHLNKDIYRECFSFNGFNIVSLFAEYLMYRTDTIIIGIMMGPASVVPYNIAARLCQMIREPVAQIGEIFLPKAGELHARDEHSKIASLLYKGIGFAFLLTASVLIGGSFFGDLLISTWIDPVYSNSCNILTFLMLAQVVSLPMQIVRRVLLGMGFVRFPSIALFCASIMNISIAVSLIPHYGLWGMVAGMVIPVFLIDLLVILPMACRTIGMTAWGVLSRAILPQLPPLLALALYCFYVDQWELKPGWMNVLMVTGGGALITGLIWLPIEFKNKFKSMKKVEPADVILPNFIDQPETETSIIKHPVNLQSVTNKS